MIGLACRFPGAVNPCEFWRNLEDGVESMTFYSDELESLGAPRDVLDDSRYVKAAGVLHSVDWFDAGFVAVNPKEVETMDPQHRFEDSSYDPDRVARPIGTFVGAYKTEYLMPPTPGTTSDTSCSRSFIGEYCKGPGLDDDRHLRGGVR